ncbi:MAG TPA: hypothetical protein VE046_02035 [Steroidobacteraceae bacterium]|nr:hypothetical protein [Steroidobacteraceae bacterium]
MRIAFTIAVALFSAAVLAATESTQFRVEVQVLPECSVSRTVTPAARCTREIPYRVDGRMQPFRADTDRPHRLVTITF